MLEDAKAVADRCVDGIMLSNHGGRQLDRAPIPFLLLPTVARELGRDTEILVDTGVMSGADIVAATALGARCTLVGGACEHLCSSFCVTLRGEQQWQHAVWRLAAQPHHPWTHGAEVDQYASFDLCSHPHAVGGCPPLGTGIGVRATVAVMKR